MKDLTPPHLRCGIGTCPAVFEKDDGRLVFIGRRVSTEHKERVGTGEEAIEIDPELLDALIRRACLGLGYDR